MGFRIFAYFFISFFAFNAVAKTSYDGFKGKALTYRGKIPLDMRNIANNQAVPIAKSTTLILLKDDEVTRLVRRPDPKMVYFRVALKKGIPGILGFPVKKFENLLMHKNKFFGSWERKKYLEDRLKIIKERSKKYVEGKIIDNWLTEIKVLHNDNLVKIPAGKKLFVIKTNKAKNLPEYDPKKIFFHPVNPATGTADSSKYYGFPYWDFETLMAKGQFGNHLTNKWEQNGKISEALIVSPRFTKIRKSSEVEEELRTPSFRTNTYYTITNGMPILIKDRLTGNQVALNRNQKFYLTFENGSAYIVKSGSQRRFTFSNDILHNMLINGTIKQGKKVNFEQLNPPLRAQPAVRVAEPAPEPIAPQEEPLATPSQVDPFATPTDLANALGVIDGGLIRVDGISEPIQARLCPADINEYRNTFDSSCNSKNNYLQKKLKGLLGEAEVYENYDEKYCILAGLKLKPTFKMAKCNGNKLVSSTAKACVTKEYVTFIYKEIKQTAECFKNINFLEMLPLIYAESKFNFNAYNKNSDGSLNASGLMQVTQGLIKSQSSTLSYFDRNKFLRKNNSYCDASFSQLSRNKLPTERNVCKRTNIPGQFRKNLLLAMAQYSKFKHHAEEKLDSLQQNYGFANMFDSSSKDKISTELARLMHNRGNSKVETLLEMFFYDLLRGGEGLGSKTKNTVVGSRRLDLYDAAGNRVYDGNGNSVITDVPIIRKHPHGNPKIHRLWGSPKFRIPLDHLELKTMFSSYVFYEANRSLIRLPKVAHKNRSVTQKIARRNNERYLEPTDKRLQDEGGTFLHKISCVERTMEIDARRASGKNNIVCGHPSPTKKELEELRLSVGWYKKVCDPGNNSHFSKRKCNAKNPITARSSSGVRRLPSTSVKNLKKDDNQLYHCNRHSLRGIAARPLIRYYSSEAETYQ